MTKSPEYYERLGRILETWALATEPTTDAWVKTSCRVNWGEVPSHLRDGIQQVLLAYTRSLQRAVLDDVSIFDIQPVLASETLYVSSDKSFWGFTTTNPVVDSWQVDSPQFFETYR